MDDLYFSTRLKTQMRIEEPDVLLSGPVRVVGPRSSACKDDERVSHCVCATECGGVSRLARDAGGVGVIEGIQSLCLKL